jgi:hypothetical protein
MPLLDRVLDGRPCLDLVLRWSARCPGGCARRGSTHIHATCAETTACRPDA